MGDRPKESRPCGIVRRLQGSLLRDAAHRVTALKRVYRVFEGNWRSHRGFLDSLRDPDIALPMFDIRDGSSLDRTLQEAEWLLVNFLASAKALIYHTRRRVGASGGGARGSRGGLRLPRKAWGSWQPPGVCRCGGGQRRSSWQPVSSPDLGFRRLGNPERAQRAWRYQGVDPTVRW